MTLNYLDLKYRKYIEDINLTLNDLFKLFERRKNKNEKELCRIATSNIKNSGKRLRPLLALLSCEAICGNYKQALPIAVSYELGHTSALIQDDIIDQSFLRRGKPSTISKYGKSIAILTSDLLLFQIFHEISKYKKSNLSKERLYEILEIIGTSSKLSTIGEYLDDKYTMMRTDLSKRDYFFMIKLKTAELFGGAMACGAVVAEGTKKEINIMYKVGQEIGFAFQIYDDILDIIGKERVVGKDIFNDLKKGEQNIVIIHTLRNAFLEEKKFIKQIFGKRNISSQEIKKCKEIFKRNGSINYAKKIAEEKLKKAKRYLKEIKPTPVKRKILEIAHLVTRRNL